MSTNNAQSLTTTSVKFTLPMTIGPHPMNPFRQLHPNLKKCNCGFISTRTGFNNHMEAKERLAKFMLQTDKFWKEHGEVPIYEDEATFTPITRTERLATL